MLSYHVDDEVLRTAAKQLYADRQQADKLGFTPPGQAEFLDILRALPTFAKTKNEQLNALEKIQDFALKKFKGMQENAKPPSGVANNETTVDGKEP